MAQGGASGGGGGQDSAEQAYTLLWIVAAIFVLSIAIWYFWSDQLKWFFIVVKQYEIRLLSFFIQDENIKIAERGLQLANVNNLNLEFAGKISRYIGGYLLYPACLVLLILGVILFRVNAGMRFTKAYNMNMLVHQEKDNWPQISPVVDIDLLEEDINQGPWAMCMNPLQFAKHYQLISVERVPDKKAIWRAEGMIKMTLHRERAAQVFSDQLGPLWTGVEGLPPHAKAIYAAFLARVEHDTKPCLAFLSTLAASAAKGTVDYSDTQAYLKKYARSKAAQRCHTKHAYVLTVMASILELARIDGVLPSADFLWLKPIDRRLWYVLNSVGRQVAPAEVGGVFAHWLAEKHMGHKLMVPMVDEAVKGLEKALDTMVYVPAEDEKI